MGRERGGPEGGFVLWGGCLGVGVGVVVSGVVTEVLPSVVVICVVVE